MNHVKSNIFLERTLNGIQKIKFLLATYKHVLPEKKVSA